MPLRRARWQVLGGAAVPRPLRLLLAVLGLAVAGGSLAVAAAQDAVLDVTGLTFVGSRESSNEVVLRAATAHFQPETSIAHLERVYAVVHHEDETLGFEITCDRAELDLDTNDFRAEGHVEGTTASGRHFSSEWVEYDSADGVLRTDAPVTIREGAGTFRGGGFRYHVSEQRFRLLGGATVVQEP